MSWFQRNRKSNVSRRRRYPLGFEVLEDRWVPSTLVTPTLLTAPQVSASVVQTQTPAATGQHSDDSFEHSPSTATASSPTRSTQQFIADDSTNDFSQPKTGVGGTTSSAGAPQHVTEVEDSATGTQVSQTEHEDSATSTSVGTTDDSTDVSHPLTGGSQPPQATPQPQSTNNVATGGDDVHPVTTGAPSEVAQSSESPASTRIATPNNGGTSSNITRTASVSENNAEESPREATSPSAPSGSRAIVTRQLDVNQRPGDGYLPGHNGPGNDSHMLISGKPIGQLPGMQRGDGFFSETSRLDPEGTEEGRLRAEGTYLAQTELIEEVPLDATALEAAWQNLLANLESCVNDLVHLSGQTGLAPFVLAAVMAVAILELARRRLYYADVAIELFEAADGKSSGLKHFSTGPQP